MKEKKSQYSIWAPIIRKKLKEQEEKKGEKLTKEEKNKTIKKEKRKCRRRAGVVAVVAALGFTAGYSNVKLLPEGKDNKTAIEETAKTERENFLENNKVAETPKVKNNEKEDIQELLNEYGVKKEDISYIKSKPDFIYVDNNGNYVFDYRQKTDAPKFITQDKENSIGNVYSFINKKDNKIIASIGEINYKIVNIDTNQVTNRETGKEYFKSEKYVNLNKNKDGKERTQEELEKIYSSVEKEYQHAKEQKEIEER